MCKRYKENKKSMTKHNEEVLKCLNDYLKVKRPGYAVLIKGSWGCGKTYFIKKWLDTLSDNNAENDNDVIIKPIYVSLYGMSSTNQIDEEVKRIISPILHSKAMKKAGKVLKVAISAAIRYNIDLNDDGDVDMKMKCTIDPKALLSSNDNHVKGNRLLVFDDLERSNMNIQEVLGYINFFVEHIGCNVVIAGDDTKLKDLNEYKNIKEKTIGREFLIDPDVNSAVESFINVEHVLGKDYLIENKNVIIDCFNVSGTNNLRLLKQSLNDFSLMIDRIPESLKKKTGYALTKSRLLANFVAVYAEDKGQEIGMDNYSEQLGEDKANQIAIDFTEHEDSSSREMINKYNKYKIAGLTEKYYALAPDYVDCVLAYLRTGKIKVDFLINELQKDDNKPWDILENYMNLENDVLKRNVDKNVGYLESGDFKSVDQMLRSATVMLRLIHWGLCPKYNTDKVIFWCTKIMKEQFYGKCKTQNELHNMRSHVLTCMHYYTLGNSLKEYESFMTAIDDIFKEKKGNLKNDMTEILESLCDDSIDDLYRIYGGSTPDHSTSYSNSAIFANVEPEKFVMSFVALKNESKSKIVSFIVSHYREALNIQNLEDMVHHYIDDLKTLPHIIMLLGLESEKSQLVDKLNISLLKNNLEKSAEKIRTANTLRQKRMNAS